MRTAISFNINANCRPGSSFLQLDAGVYGDAQPPRWRPESSHHLLTFGVLAETRGKILKPPFVAALSGAP